MAKKKLLWQLFPTYLLITFTAIFAVGGYSVNSLRNFYYERTIEDLKTRVRLVEHLILKSSPTLNTKKIKRLSQELGGKTGTRITIIDLLGNVLGDSHEDPLRMSNHADRPEFRSAVKGEAGTSVRFSNTLEERMMYFAIPLKRDDKIKGVVRTSIPITFIDRALKSVEIKIASAGLIIGFLAAGISLLVSRRISRPIEEIKSVAGLISKGEWSDELSVQSDSIEIATLADSLNQMVAKLDSRIRTITEQRNEREAVLSSMVEGVLAVDAQEQLISMNHAAGKLIGVHPGKAEGRPIQEVIRHSALLKFINEILAGSENSETELSIGNENYLQANGAILQGSQGPAVGAVIVLNDITRLRKLETIRRDFVSNVSHELKTPITLIQGFVETLLQGAMESTDETERFLKIIGKQVGRMNAIIEDLLTLSRLEQDPESTGILMEKIGIKGILESAVRDCTMKASDRNLTIHLNCEEDLLVSVNPPLFIQAVINLVDNAIKYSVTDDRIEINVSKNNSEVVVIVQDWGCGIDSKYLPRLFERFYRIDEARSRKLGGTGLGLAIVKHIAQSHGGKVSVESALGKGSLFTIHLPAEST